MLRPTAAKAFAPRRERRTLEWDPAAPRDRLEAVKRLFSVLHRTLTREVNSGLDALGEKWETGDRPSGLSSRGGAPFHPYTVPLRIGRERTLLEGSEFVLETPRRSYRFLNTQDGIIWVFEVREGGLQPREILSVQRVDEGYQLIRKQLGPGRGGFQFTSVKALVDAYLADLRHRGGDGGLVSS